MTADTLPNTPLDDELDSLDIERTPELRTSRTEAGRSKCWVLPEIKVPTKWGDVTLGEQFLRWDDPDEPVKVHFARKWQEIIHARRRKASALWHAQELAPDVPRDPNAGNWVFGAAHLDDVRAGRERVAMKDAERRERSRRRWHELKVR